MSSLSVPPSSSLGSDFDDEIIIGISSESIISSISDRGPDSLPLESITRDFILEIDLTNRRSDIVRV